MNSFLTNERANGILAHITSLPSPFGIGDIGPSSYKFLDFLHFSGQRYWQFLPVGPTKLIFDNSPYMNSSVFAGSPLLISCELLKEHGLISQEILNNHPDFSEYVTEFDQVITFKEEILKKAYSNFDSTDNSDYKLFLSKTDWLDDYALFMALKEKYPHGGWFDWPEKIVQRDETTILRLHQELKRQIDYYRFEQFEFFRQWQLFHSKASEKNIKLIGDIPIYVATDSADVWANQDIFTLDPNTHLPTHVAGVPPDYFSETGQRWGNPLYRWQTDDQETGQKLFTWWKQRLKNTFHLVDIVRIDHFRGFVDYWSIDAREETAIKGEWLTGPGKQFFDRIFSELGPLDIIAEDLGIITPEVNNLRDSLGFPGMKILQFGFDDNPENSFLPHNFTTSNCVVYTGTHDNDTSLGWFLSDQNNDALRNRIKNYANRRLHDSSLIYRDMIYLAMGSISALAIIPLQDVLGYGNDCRMNSPGTSSGNWRWRCTASALNDEIIHWLHHQTSLFGRS